MTPLLRFIPEIEPGDTTMTPGIVRWVMAAALAAGAGLAQPKAAGAAATFVDAAAWQAAMSGLKLPQPVIMPSVSPELITMSDAWGNWTLAEQDTATITITQNWGPGSLPRSSIEIILMGHPRLSNWSRSEQGEMFASFGCSSAVYPCLGMEVVELELDTPILGFAGDLRYYWGYSGNYRPGEGFITHFEGIHGHFQPYTTRYQGFYGVIFDEPVTTLRFAWREGQNHDNSSYFHFTNMVMIGVPEPGLLLTFSAGVLLLVSGSRGTGLPRAVFAWRRERLRR